MCEWVYETRYEVVVHPNGARTYRTTQVTETEECGNPECTEFVNYVPPQNQNENAPEAAE